MDVGRKARTALFGALILGIAGCLPQQEGDNEWLAVGPTMASGRGDVAMLRDVQFADIPIPSGYSIIPHESYSFQGSLFRNGVLKYHGPVDWNFAINFYRRHLPARGWILNNVERGFDVRVFYFSKGQEKLIVIVRQIAGGSRTELQLDNIDKNDLLLKGRLTDPGYTAPPTYMQPQPQQPQPQQPQWLTPLEGFPPEDAPSTPQSEEGYNESGTAPENTFGSSPIL